MTLDELMQEYSDYQRVRTVLRFGQWVINKYFPTGSMPDIFYEKDKLEAFKKLVPYCEGG